MSHTLLLVDAYSQIYRAFFAIRSLSDPQGQPVNAVFGFTKMLNKLLADFQPTHTAVVFDLGAPQQRLDVLPSYKENRPPTPPDLNLQLPAIRDVLRAMRLPIVELAGEEADDIIATLATRAAVDGARVLIATNDKDLMQLVSQHIRLIRNDGSLLDEAGVRERYRVPPERVVDLLSLTGDAVDNIPGVPGVGEKTAAELMNQFGTLDSLFLRTTEITKPKLRENVLERASQLRRNQQLISLNRELALSVAWRDLVCQAPDTTCLAALYRQFGFKSLLAEVENKSVQTDLFKT